MTVEQIARAGAQQMLSRALEAEINAYLAGYSDVLTADGKKAVVRNGTLPQRTLSTAFGPVDISVPKNTGRS